MVIDYEIFSEELYDLKDTIEVNNLAAFLFE